MIVDCKFNGGLKDVNAAVITSLIYKANIIGITPTIESSSMTFELMRILQPFGKFVFLARNSLIALFIFERTVIKTSYRGKS